MILNIQGSLEWASHHDSRPTVRQTSRRVGMRDRSIRNFASSSGMAGRSDLVLLVPLWRHFSIRTVVSLIDSEGCLTHR